MWRHQVQAIMGLGLHVEELADPCSTILQGKQGAAWSCPRVYIGRFVTNALSARGAEAWASSDFIGLAFSHVWMK